MIKKVEIHKKNTVQIFEKTKKENDNKNEKTRVII